MLQLSSIVTSYVTRCTEKKLYIYKQLTDSKIQSNRIYDSLLWSNT